MKKVLVLFVGLILVSSMYAFDAGTKTVGGWIGYESYTPDKDADAITTLTFGPHGGYFVIDNLCAEFLFEYSSTNSKEWDDPITQLGIGIGGRYFYDNIYGGLGFLMQSVSVGDISVSANYMQIRLGYLYGIAENIYVDFGGKYHMGIGEYGGDGEGDNEETGFEIGAGIDIFFP